jgi:hypothetical protein
MTGRRDGGLLLSRGVNLSMLFSDFPFYMYIAKTDRSQMRRESSVQSLPEIHIIYNPIQDSNTNPTSNIERMTGRRDGGLLLSRGVNLSMLFSDFPFYVRCGILTSLPPLTTITRRLFSQSFFSRSHNFPSAVSSTLGEETAGYCCQGG